MDEKKYRSSRFYEKYGDTYYSDCIEKKVLFVDEAKTGKVKGLPRITKMSYEDIYRKNIKVIHDFFELYLNDMDDSDRDEEQAYQMIRSFYIDPDGAKVKEAGGITCTADGLISVKRLYFHEGLTERFIKGYKIYRKIPVFYFPKEKNGINMTRASVFGDRIDHSLYDLKRYFDAASEEERDSCRLISAYRLPLTGKWLEEMSSFEGMVDWFGVKGIFTDENYEVIDLEKNDGSVIRGYLPWYGWEWSEAYYEALKGKIEAFYNLPPDQEE